MQQIFGAESCSLPNAAAALQKLQTPDAAQRVLRASGLLTYNSGPVRAARMAAAPGRPLCKAVHMSLKKRLCPLKGTPLEYLTRVSRACAFLPRAFLAIYLARVVGVVAPLWLPRPHPPGAPLRLRESQHAGGMKGSD